MKPGHRQAWQALVGQSEEEVTQKLLHGLPEGTQASIRYEGGETFDLRLFKPTPGSQAQDRDFSFLYSIAPGAGTYLIDATVQQRGQNISARANCNMALLSEELRSPCLAVIAVGVGTYLWGKAGFLPCDFEWDRMRHDFGHRFKQLRRYGGSGIPDAVVQSVQQSLASEDPHAFWQVIDHGHRVEGLKLGQYLTQSVPWNGVLDFSDPPSVQRFAGHVAERWPSAPSTAFQRLVKLGAANSGLRRSGKTLQPL